MRASFVLLFVALAGCSPGPRGLAWEIALDDPRRESAVASWETWIATGACPGAASVADAGAMLDAGTPGGASALRFHASFARGAAAPAPPVLGEGRHAFVVVGRDASCRVVLAGCADADLPLRAGSRVRVSLGPASGPPCDGCASGMCPSEGATYPPPHRRCGAWQEASCGDGDDDCDGAADCDDDDCATDVACACATDADCGACGRCDRARGACRSVGEGTPCVGPGSTVGACSGGACCTGCRLDGACVPGITTLGCGAAGAACEVCECAADTCESSACVVRGNVASAVAGDGTSCVLDAAGAPYCFGDPESGRLGVGDSDPHPTPTPVRCVGGGAPCSGWTALTMGRTHGCGIRRASGIPRLACWGANEHGQLGRGPVSASLVPVNVGGALSTGAMVPLHVLDASAGDGFTCAVVSADGTGPGLVYCWGDAEGGRLGAPTVRDNDAPFRVPFSDTGLDFTRVTTGRAHACALTTAGALYCWGHAERGQIGRLDAGATVTSPARVSGTWGSVVAGGDHTCAHRLTGTPPTRPRLECWGANASGQLGVGDTADRREPTQLMTLGSGREYALSLGAAHTCALAPDGELWCWGDDSDGRIGAGGADTRLPFRVTTGVASIAAGYDHTCLVRTAGTLECGGNALRGQLGRVTTAAFEPRARTCVE